jgi:hypothetical protein
MLIALFFDALESRITSGSGEKPDYFNDMDGCSYAGVTGGVFFGIVEADYDSVSRAPFVIGKHVHDSLMEFCSIVHILGRGKRAET